jgi:protein-L-isoaspartate(D-aspartate) O-methyltransferase
MRTADAAHHEFIDMLVARAALRSAALIAAFRATPRHRFLDRIWGHRDGQWRSFDPENPQEDDLSAIYSDRALTTKVSSPGPGEAPVAVSSSSQPSLMAQMLEDLHLAPEMRVLEIGAGTGYNAALLAHVTGDVISVDIDREVLADAQRHLQAFPDRRVDLVHSDGRIGWPAAAPYDRIQVTAASEDLEPAWLDQLRPGGLVQVPLDLAPGLAWIVQGEVSERVFEGRLIRPAYFMPLRDEDDPGRDRAVSTGPLPGPERLQSVTAPWANWQERRSSFDSCEFLGGIALLAWLEGSSLGYATCPDGRPGFGIGDLVRGQACWLGPYEWRISGKGGVEMGMALWRRWLDLGGPRPEDWRLLAGTQAEQLLETAGAKVSVLRQGPRCLQRWELIEGRQAVVPRG